MEDNIISLEKYKVEKREVLKELGIRLNKSQQTHLSALQNEIQIDNFARDLIHAVPYEAPKRRKGGYWMFG